MIVTKIEIEGIEYPDYTTLNIVKNIDLYNAVSNFTVSYDSPFGRHANDFNVGDEIVIYAKESSMPVSWSSSDKVFTGTIDKVQLIGDGNSQYCTLTGKDYTTRILDSTAEPIIFTDTEVSEIVKQLISRNTSDLTINNVNATSTTLDRIAFNQTSLFDSLKELADLSGHFFYVDVNKDVHFEEQNTVSSGVVLNNSNIYSTNYQQTREGLVNEVYVYGDRTLAGFQEVINFDGGSVYTLLSRPHNTLLTINGSPQVGNVEGLTLVPSSGTNYLVSFYDKQIIFTSGADIGNSIPASGGSGIITYDRDIPIVKKSSDRASIDLYGLKRKVISDKSIKDPATAQDILNKALESNSPKKGMEINLKGWHNFSSGQTVDVLLENLGIDDTIKILSINYDFNKTSMFKENVITVKLDSKIKTLGDEIQSMRSRLEKLESQDMSESDVITNIESTAGSLFVVGSYWEVRSRDIRASFILGHPINGILGSPAVAVNGSQVILGDYRTTSVVEYSGGFYS